MASSTVEDYLKTIYAEQIEKGSDPVPTGHIAARLEVTPGTATAMMKTLAESGLITYEPYAGVRMTKAGKKLAMHVLRRHRVVELFLVQIMGMDWSEVHDDAEILEHVISDRLLERMDEMLGRPQVDPHGDPIPSRGGDVNDKRPPSLVSCTVGEPLRVARILDQDGTFLRLMERRGLMPGSRVEVTFREESADSVAIRPENASVFTLGFRAAAKILVERDDE